MSMQRIVLTGVIVIILLFGLVLAATNWPMTREITYVQCDAIAKTCSTIIQPYKVGSEGAAFFGIFLVIFGLIVLSLLLAYYVKYMFTAMKKKLQKLFSK